MLLKPQEIPKKWAQLTSSSRLLDAESGERTTTTPAHTPPPCCSGPDKPRLGRRGRSEKDGDEELLRECEDGAATVARLHGTPLCVPPVFALGGMRPVGYPTFFGGENTTGKPSEEGSTRRTVFKQLFRKRLTQKVSKNVHIYIYISVVVHFILGNLSTSIFPF